MDLTRISTLLLGAWIGGCVFMDTVATQNFRSVDRLLAAPAAPFAERIQAMGGHDAARAFLRFQASELNRQYFTTWENTQIVLGLLVIGTLVAAGHRDRVTIWLPSLMLVITLIMHFLLTPEIIRLGRAMDFAPLGQTSANSTRFWVFHGGYSALELIKLGWGVALAIWLMLPRKNKQLKETGAATETDPGKVA
jgi:hypothetical protein